jgi:nitrite reductase (NADH) large subunit
MNHVVIGSGVAGIEAALAIREKDRNAGISIISASKYPFYYRPRLIDFIKDNLPPEKLYAYKDSFWSEKGISVQLDTRICTIDHANKNVIDDTDRHYQYDKLLLAVGASPNIPPMNNTCEGVFTLRGIHSAERIRDYCRGKKHLIIAGGGLLGVETAHALKNHCEKITVIDVAPCLLPRQLDERGAETLQKILEERGLRFLFGDSVKTVKGKDGIEGVILNSGIELEADALVISAGVHPNIVIASGSGITVKKGILVDDYFRTSAADVYAAGDCIEHRELTYGLWTIAKEQGRMAGLNMTGESNEYKGSIPSASLKVTGIDLYSAGDYSLASDNALLLEKTGKYAKIIYNGDVPAGAVVVGDSDIVKAARKAMSGKMNADELKKIMGI